MFPDHPGLKSRCIGLYTTDDIGDIEAVLENLISQPNILPWPVPGDKEGGARTNGVNMSRSYYGE